MLKGDLAATPLPQVLRQLADGGATGCLHLVDDSRESGQDEGKVYLRNGRVYAVTVPGTRPTLGARLVTSGALGPEALAEALEAQRTELQGWRLGELLVHLGYVDQPVVEDFVREQVREQTSELLHWTQGTWRFRINHRTREDVAPPVDIEDLLVEVEERWAAWRAILPVVGGPDAVPLLSAAGTTDDEMVVDGDAWSLLCKVDGVRTIGELARDCGLTLFEAGHVVHGLVQAGLLEMEGAEELEPVEALVPADVASRLAGAFARRDEPQRVLIPASQDEVDATVSRVSDALSALLGNGTYSEDLFAVPPQPRKAPPAGPTAEEVEAQHRKALRRERDGEELAAAQAELEAARAAHEAQFTAEVGEDHVAEVVDLQARRDEDEARAAEAARLAEEARQAEARQAEARQAEEARLAAAAEVSRLAAEAQEAERARPEAHEAHERSAAEAQEAARLAEQTAGLATDSDDMRHVAALQAAAFAELSEAAAVEVPAPEPAEVPTAPQPEPVPAWHQHDTDTAALLRELSSLGLDEDPPAPPLTRPVSSSRPVPVQQQKKRKGLFGRG
ncbi:MAG: hypothetical protein JWM96_1368 [Alphaproteobacteria bacterium]|nr:hypothetical protein [Alphaproteobacteria bacterium]